MHKTVLSLIAEEQQDIDRYLSSNYNYEEEIQEKKHRISELKRLWLKFEDNPLIQKMVTHVDKKVNHYHADFFYWDLKLLEQAVGRFAWYVGDCGTFIIFLENSDSEEEKKQKYWLDAIQKSYGHYALYEGDVNLNTLKKTKYENLFFSYPDIKSLPN